MGRKSKVTNHVNKVNDSRKFVSDIEKKLNSEKSPITRERLLSIKKKVELWARMEEGDMEAMAELSYNYGLWSKEDCDGFLKMEDDPDYD